MAKSTDDGLTERALLSLVIDAQALEESTARLVAQVNALAARHGIEPPAPEGEG